MLLITSTNEHIQLNHHLYFDKTSVGFPSTKSIYIIVDEPIESFNTNKIDSNEFSFYKIENDIPVTYKQLDLSKLDYTLQNNKYIYKISLMLDSNVGGDYYSNVELIINDSIYKIVCGGEVEEISERLMVVLQNFKKFLDDDYMTAFMESKNDSKTFDAILYNRKVREFLLNIKELSLHGSYLNLFSILKFFGFGDLLDIREYWFDGKVYKDTSILNKVVTHIDKSLIGFRKTKMMSLVYKINKENGFDDDGLPTYENVLEMTDDVLVKLYAVKKILEREYLYFGTHIVDIIGEYSAVVGYELNVNSSKAIVMDINLTDNIFSEVLTENSSSEVLHIKPNKVYVNDLLFKSNEQKTKLEFLRSDKSNNVNVFGDFFEIFKPYESDADEYDILTKLYTGVFAMLRYDIKIDVTRYSGYGFTVLSGNGSIVFETDKKDISEFLGFIMVGIKKVGNYRVIPYFIDHYGGYTYVGNEIWYEVTTPYVKLNLFHYDENSELQSGFIPQYSTFYSSQRGLIIPPISNTAYVLGDDLSNYQMINSEPLKYYSTEYDYFDNQVSMNQLNSLTLEKISGNKFSSYGAQYLIMQIDVIGDPTKAGLRKIGLKTNDGSNYIYFSKYWNNDNTSYSGQCYWLNMFIEEIRKSNIDIYNLFTYDINFYSDDPSDVITNGFPILRLRSKESSVNDSIYSCTVDNQYKKSRFVDCYFTQTVNVLTPIDSNIGFSMYRFGVTSDLIFKLENDVVYEYKSVKLNNMVDFKTFIESKTELKDLIYISACSNDKIQIYCKFDILIVHDSFGTQSDIVRGKQFRFIRSIKSGKEIDLGKIFICTFNHESIDYVSDIEWQLINELNGSVLTRQKSHVLKYLINRSGTYNVKVNYKLNGIDQEKVINGAVLVL